MVLSIFSAVGGLIKVKLSRTDIDNHIFRLHYSFTSSLLFIACALVAANEYIGDPIQCVYNNAPAPKYMNTFCWISSTFTINTTEKEGDIAGLGNHANREKTYHAYYQWVPFVLFFQGCMFYLPHLLWKNIEGKTVQCLLQGLHRFTMDKEVPQKRDNIVKFMKESKGCNRKYWVQYFICEVLNFVNVIAQLFLLDEFFGGTFLNYGVNVWDHIINDTDDDPFRTVFPKLTKCSYKKIGPSGTLQDRHPICILPQNILNEKVFVIIWFWFVILATITGMQLVWRVVCCFSPVIRVRMLERKGKMDASHQLERSIQHLHLGDFMLLDILGKNLDAVTFREVLMGAVLDEDANANAYNNLKHNEGDEDDDDPVSLKRRMEMNEAAEDGV